MASLQIRELPEQIYLKLKEEAQKKHRSLAQQATISLSKGLNVRLDAKERRIELMANLKEYHKKNKYHQLSDPVEMIRKDRER